MATRRALIVVAALAGTAAIAATALVLDAREQRARADRAQLALTLGGAASMDALTMSTMGSAFDSMPMHGGAGDGLRGMTDAPDVVFGATGFDGGRAMLQLPDGWIGADALAPADDELTPMTVDAWNMFDANDPYGIGMRWDDPGMLWTMPRTRWVPQRKALVTDSERTDK